MTANVAFPRPTISIVATALVLLAAASLPAQEIRYGAPVQLGGGAMRTYLVVDAEGHPLELGVALSEAAVQNPPDLPDEEPSLDLDLAMPEGNPTPFRFAAAGWNPRGHPPAGIYTVPHFDVHFYLIDPAARDAIAPADTTDMTDLETRGSKAPAEGLMPENYVYPGEATVPRMGGHWIDPASHEFHGVPFDMTFIYGTWDGQIIFAEPMIGKAYLESRPDTTVGIATPVRYATPGWYPSAYRIVFDEDAEEYRVALTGFAEWK